MNIASQVKLVRRVTEQLRDELAALTPDELETPRACGDWTVAEVASHLAQAGERYALWVRRALEGYTDPPEGSGFVADRAAASAGVKQRAVAHRRELGTEIVGAFERSSLDLVELFERLQPNDWQRRSFHPVEVVPLADLVTWRLAELSVHRWDIMSALGRDASLPEDSLEPMVAWLPRWLKVAFSPGPPLAEPRQYLFVLGSPLLRLVKLTIYGDRYELDRKDDQSSDAVLTTHPETYILLMLGRYDWKEAFDQEAVVIGNDRKAAYELPRWLGAL